MELRSILITDSDSNNFNMRLKDVLSSILPEDLVTLKFSTAPVSGYVFQYSAVIVYKVGVAGSSTIG